MMMDEIITLEAVMTLAQKLSAVDRVRLVGQLVTTLEHDLQPPHKTPKQSLYGVLAGMGISISDEDIDRYSLLRVSVLC
ncbi:MAG: hypothetical protein SFZ02_15430 [bacterium]|nr:hypothetical protein [bacterium]